MILFYKISVSLRQILVKPGIKANLDSHIRVAKIAWLKGYMHLTISDLKSLHMQNSFKRPCFVSNVLLLYLMQAGIRTRYQLPQPAYIKHCERVLYFLKYISQQTLADLKASQIIISDNFQMSCIWYVLYIVVPQKCICYTLASQCGWARSRRSSL